MTTGFEARDGDWVILKNLTVRLVSDVVPGTPVARAEFFPTKERALYVAGLMLAARVRESNKQQ